MYIREVRQQAIVLSSKKGFQLSSKKPTTISKAEGPHLFSKRLTIFYDDLRRPGRLYTFLHSWLLSGTYQHRQQNSIRWDNQFDNYSTPICHTV